MTLLELLKLLISKDKTLPPKTARENIDTLLKIAVKLVLLFTHGVLRPKDMDSLHAISEKLLIELLLEYDNSRFEDYQHRADPALGEAAARRLCALFKEVETELLRCISAHTTDKNVSKLRTVTNYFCVQSNLERILTQDEFAENLADISDTVRSMLMR